MSQNNDFDYRPAPFWFLNHHLEKSEIKRQIKLMAEADISGFFIHPRAGLLTPYGSEKWFEIIDFIVEEAEKAGLKAWLYDEDPFPSGIAGGRVVFENINHAAKALKIVKLKPDSNKKVYGSIGRGKLLSAYAIKCNSKGEVSEKKNITQTVGIIRPSYFKFKNTNTYYAVIRDKKTFEHMRAETFFPELFMETILEDGEWTVYATIAELCVTGDKFGFIPDNLNKECVQSFIELTHEKYFKGLGQKFGSTIPGIFTDEPYAGGNIPWTDALESEFEKENGYSIKDNYFHLADSFGNESKKIRRDYWAIIHKLYRENFFGQISKWCREKGLLLVGHVIAEEDPVAQVFTGGSAFAYQTYFDIPGFDIIAENLGDRDYPTLLFGGKLISSAAHQQGKKQVLSECMACNAFNFGLEGMKKFANWLFAVGVTWLVPHGFYYSYDGYRKYDAGKSFFFQDNYYSEFSNFSKYVQRLGNKLSDAEHVSNVCILNPVMSFWELMPVEQINAEALRNQIYSLIKNLFENHIEFDIIDDETLMNSEIKDGFITCGNENYSILIVPDSPYLSDKYGLSIKKLENLGLQILWSNINGEINLEKIKSLSCIWADIVGVNEESEPRDLITYKKKTEKETLIYIFNNSPTPGYFSMKRETQPYCYVYNADQNNYSDVKIESEKVMFGLGSYEAILLVFTDLKKDNLETYTMPQNIAVIKYEHEQKPLWHYIPPCGCLSYIKFWDVYVKGSSYEQEFKRCEFALVREMVGTELGYVKNQAKRASFDRVKEIPSVYPIDAVFSSTFNIKSDIVNGKNKIFMVIERETFTGQYRLYINDKQLQQNQFERRIVYDYFNYVCDVTDYIKKGENQMRVEFSHANEFDGIKSLIYFMHEGCIPNLLP